MDAIFTHFISRGDVADANRRLSYASWFVSNIPVAEFVNEERLFYNFLEYCVELSIFVNYKHLQVWIETELREILHKTNVRVVGCEALSFDDPASFETAYRVTSDVMTDNFKVLETMDSEVDDFKVDVAAYFSRKKGERLTSALSSTFDLLNKTDSSEEASNYALDTLNAIQDIYDATHLEELDTQSVDTHEQFVRVSDCGLPAIDNDSGGLYTTQLFGVEAQPGTGKTRYVLGTYCYRAATLHHKNVLFLSLEQTRLECEAMLIACHTFHMFNIQISDKMILTGTVPAKVAKQVEAAKFDLFESGKYGKLVCLEKDLYAETFISKLRAWDKLMGPFDLIAIDYMGLIESQPAQYQKTLTEFEIIKTSFKQFKRYLRHSKKAGIAISQFNREGVQAGKNDKEITTDMAQGGMAVYRNTDYNTAISMTDTMKLQQKRKFSQPKVRSSSGFPAFIANTRLAFCFFEQITAKQV